MYKAFSLAAAALLASALSASSATAPNAHGGTGVQTAAARCFGKSAANWQQLSEACTALLASKDLQPSARAVALYNRGIASQRLNPTSNAKALADFSAALKVKADFAPALAARGSLFVASGKLDDGVSDLSKAIAAEPK